MNNLRQFFVGLILTLALTSTAFAGQVECPGITQEPPQEEITSETQSTTASESIITEALRILIDGALLVP
jgi:hypothetical protein